MDAQQQIQPPLIVQDNKKRLKKRLIIVALIILVLIVSTVSIFSILGTIPGIWATVISTLFTIFGLFFAIVPMLSTDKPDTSVANPPQYVVPPINIHLPPSAPSTPLPPPSQPDKPAHRGIASLPPPSDPRTIQQREPTVKAVCTMLTQPDITAVALTGIGGAGKSTLAALIYRYVEAQQRAGNRPFTAQPLWLRIDPSVTLADILGNLCDALNVPPPDLSTLSPQNQAVALFNTLHSVGKGRLIVLDQFENLLDHDGHALTDRPGIGEWLDALNSQPCACRVLLTSRPDPQGTRDDPPTCLQPYHVPGLAEAEGIELLRKRNVQASEAELRTAVRRCDGHALSLTLLASLLQKRNMSLATLLKDPHYIQLWTGDIAQRLLDAIYRDQLDDVERKLLAAFSVYREPVLLDAAQAILHESTRMPKGQKKPAEILRTQMEVALEDLLTQHLLQATGEGRYQAHAVVAAYAQDHMVEGDAHDKQANQKTLLTAHARAADYYLQQAKTSCPPREKRRKVNDVHDLIEAIWQYCQAERWQEAYDLMEQERTFYDLNLWGGNVVLLELYQLLLSNNWQPGHSQASNVYFYLGWLYDDLGEKEKALSYYEQALQIDREVGNRAGEGVTLNNLGGVYDDPGDEQKALSYYEEALRILSEVGDRAGEGQTLSNLGRVYDDLGEKEQALSYYEQALRIRREVGARAGEGTTLHNIGTLYLEQGRYNIALACFLLAGKIFEEVQSPNRDEVQRRIGNLRKKVGEKQYMALLAQVEPQATQIVEQALREDVVRDGEIS